MKIREMSICCLVVMVSVVYGQQKNNLNDRINDVKLVTAKNDRGQVSNAELILDGNPETEMTFTGVNSQLTVIVDLGRACQVETVKITNGSEPTRFISQISIGPDANHFRDLLGRYVNLSCWKGGQVDSVRVIPSVGRYVRIVFWSASDRASIKDIDILGKENKPERHLLCWIGDDVEKNYIQCMDYYDKDLGVTDVWLDFVESAFPQTNPNAGFDLFEKAGVFREFQKRGIRYWLGEHESFGCLVNSPEELRDDQRWETTLERMKSLYARAKSLGFRGLVFDAEDYDGVTSAAKEKYKDKADLVDCWCFADEFGYGGYYYHRGLQVGTVIKEVWECPLINLYEARMYAGIPGCRDGHYWWLKGINDAGVEIWIATEKTYGAGNSECKTDEGGCGEHLFRWFVDPREYVAQVHKAFPFAKRYLPGFHPWNCRIKRPMYLPKYLAEQLTIARDTAFGYWIYNEGNPFGGDPRKTLDLDYCKKFQINPDDYLKVFSR